MSTPVEPDDQPTPEATEGREIEGWLEALSNGSSDEDQFVRDVSATAQNSPDSFWDALSLLDQYYRRGKIGPAQFQVVKARISRLGLSARPVGSRRALSSESGDTARPMNPSAATTDNRLPTLSNAPVAAVAGPGSAGPPVAAAVAASECRTLAGQLLSGRYRILSILGRGASGTAYEAIDEVRATLPSVDPRVALTVLYPEVAAHPERVAKLQSAFQLARTLSHPNIVRLLDFEQSGDVVYFTTGLLIGASLDRLLVARDNTPLERKHALCIIRDVGSALAYAHAQSVFHANLDPSAVFITAEGGVCVLGFGLADASIGAKSLGGMQSSEILRAALPNYSSYQILKGQEPEARDDIYSLGCVSYELLAGKHPFHRGTAFAARALGLKASRPPKTSRRQWQALRAALSWERERRPAAVHAFITSIDVRQASLRLPALDALRRSAPSTDGFLRTCVLAGVITLVLALGLSASIDYAAVARTAMRISTAGVAMSSATIARMVNALATGSGGLSVANATPSGQMDLLPLTRTGSAATTPSAPMPKRVVRAQSLAADASARDKGSASSMTSAAVPVGNAPAVSVAVRSALAQIQASQIEMSVDTLELSPTDPEARILVRRSGSLNGNLSFTWRTVAGSAKAGEDFAPSGQHVEIIPDGSDSTTLRLSIVADTARPEPRLFSVVLGETGDGASLGRHSRTTVIIPAASRFP